MVDNEEKKIPKGEYLIIEKPEGGFPDSFYKGLMKFQYGETAEESNKGFEQMAGAIKGNSLEKKTDSED